MVSDTDGDAEVPQAVEARGDVAQRLAQVADQCKAVAHLASVLAGVHSDYEAMFRAGCADQIADMAGERTAAIMETLGDMLNGMDACSEEDAWLEPIFKEAQRLWPQAPPMPDRNDVRATMVPVRPATPSQPPAEQR